MRTRICAVASRPSKPLVDAPHAHVVSAVRDHRIEALPEISFVPRRLRRGCVRRAIARARAAAGTDVLGHAPDEPHAAPQPRAGSRRASRWCIPATRAYRIPPLPTLPRSAVSVTCTVPSNTSAVEAPVASFIATRNTVPRTAPTVIGVRTSNLAPDAARSHLRFDPPLISWNTASGAGASGVWSPARGQAARLQCEASVYEPDRHGAAWPVPTARRWLPRSRRRLRLSVEPDDLDARPR